MLRLIWSAVRGAFPAVAVHVTCAVAAAVLALVEPSALARAVDAVMSHRSWGTPLVVLAAVYLAGLLARTASGLAGTVVDISSTQRLRRLLLGRALEVSAPHHSPFAAGDLVSRVGMDAGLPGAMLPMTVQLGLTAALGIGGLVALAILDWPTALVLVLAAGGGYLIVRRFVRGSAEPIMRYQRFRSDLATRLVDACTGARTIQASGTLDREVERVLRPLSGLRSAASSQWRAQRGLVFQLGLLHPLVQVLLLAVAGFRVSQGLLSPGELLAALAYAGLALGVLDEVDSVGEAIYLRTGVVRVREVLEHPPSRPVAATPQRLSDGPIALRFEDAGLDALLSGVTVEIPPGTHAAVVGRSGAGKSVLCALAGRLVDPTSGRVLLQGVDAADTDPAELRSRVAYAFEQPSLFGTTVAEAIAAGRSVSRERLAAAARAARADQFIECLPLGYETDVADLTLSGGEMQRLGVARALVGDADLLILDDATSSVDTATEAELLAVIAEAWAGRTALMVAHRPVTAAAADLVLWLEDGRLRATGRHTELLRDPEYRVLFGHSDVAVAA